MLQSPFEEQTFKITHKSEETVLVGSKSSSFSAKQILASPICTHNLAEYAINMKTFGGFFN